MITLLISIIVILGGSLAFYKLYLQPYEPSPTPSRTPEDTPNGAQTASPQTQDTQENKNIDTLVAWDTKENCRHNVRVLADLEGLSLQDKEDLSRTVHCESNYNPKCIHPNIVNGVVSSTDFGIGQINDYWHIGTGKDFPSSDFVLNNPEAVIRWMCKQWKSGNKRAWVCYSKGMCKEYSA